MKHGEDKTYRFWWAKDPTEVELFLDVLSCDDRFWTLLRKYLLNPHTVKGEVEFDLQSLCELLQTEDRRFAEEEKKTDPNPDDDGPWEAA
jgi:hypothetical protein